MVRFSGISKTFPGVRALDGVSFAVEGGTVHGLCGENGAGKSTLLKILSGAYRPDSGTLTLDQEPQIFRDTEDALAAGVAVIYQELNLVPELSVAENVWLGHLAHKGPFVDRASLAAKTRDSLARVGLDVSPWAKVSSLSLAQKQMVEIAKALSRQARVIAFDEPTSSLSAREVETLFGLIEDLRSRGIAVLYVSHRMEEVMRLCDVCTVLRDGKHVETFPMAGIQAEDIVHRMVGRAIVREEHPPLGTNAAGLDIASVMGPGLRRPVDLRVQQGEIVGLFGLIGAGRTELLKAIYMGSEGQVRVQGQEVARQGPQASIQAGLVFCPEDRKKEGIIPMLSVAENLNLSVRRRLARFGFWVNRVGEAENTDRFFRALQIRAASPKVAIGTLSGGNQQKAILARWLSEDVRAILLDEPTRGIDVGAKAEIYTIVRDLARQGVAVLFVSSELPEVLHLADRIVVMAEGEVRGELPRAEASEERLLAMALPAAGRNAA